MQTSSQAFIRPKTGSSPSQGAIIAAISPAGLEGTGGVNDGWGVVGQVGEPGSNFAYIDAGITFDRNELVPAVRELCAQVLCDRFPADGTQGSVVRDLNGRQLVVV